MFEKLTSARFIESGGAGVVVSITSSHLSAGEKVTLYADGEPILSSTVCDGQELTNYNGDREQFANQAKLYAPFDSLDMDSFDFSADYEIAAAGSRVAVSKTALFDSAAFINAFECAEVQQTEFGAVYTPQQTIFRLWAPLASEVRLNLYQNGEDGNARAVYKMKRRITEIERQNGEKVKKFCGIWEIALSGADYAGVYYTYSVKNYGAITETVDPYARACGANGIRGMVIDSEKTNPADWERDGHIYLKDKASADTPIVWEVHVGDFSASPDSGMIFCGKYSAFTETDTTVPGTDIKTGVNYLKDLGVTYVQLNPVYDFATVDEYDRSSADDTKDSFNWGYDPQNYNVPEGGYATDSTRGDVRIKEFKQMVQALHNAGIGVIMDVVYNHTYAVGGQPFADVVPGYYHRSNEHGDYTNGSGCGNETASERAMVRKYIIESTIYYATEYHIDGFRFDLMGVHDLRTIELVRRALDELDGGAGKHILTYGEPWSADGCDYIPYSFTARVKATSGKRGANDGDYTDNTDNALIKCLFGRGDVSRLPKRVAVFNGDGRDGLRGNNDPGNGWINGNPSDYLRVQKMLEGGCGTSGAGLHTGAGSRSVAYASAHDNYTLWDQMIGKRAGEETPLVYAYPAELNIRMCQTVSTAYLLSSGIPFMLAGEEMGRTKYGNHNSYNSPVKVNRIEWARSDAFGALAAHYKRVIQVRKAYADEFFSYEKSAVPEYCYGDFSGTTENGVIVFARQGGGKRCDNAVNGEKGETEEKLVCVFNPTDEKVSATVPAGLHIYVINGKPCDRLSANVVEVEPKSVAVMGSKIIKTPYDV